MMLVWCNINIICKVFFLSFKQKRGMRSRLFYCIKKTVQFLCSRGDWGWKWISRQSYGINSARCPGFSLQTMTDVVGNPEEERRADYYYQPWSQEAVCRYFYSKVGGQRSQCGSKVIVQSSFRDQRSQCGVCLFAWRSKSERRVCFME